VKESSDSLTLRPVRRDDCYLLWCWANDPVVREASTNTEPIPWEEHGNWFKNKMESDTCWLYILEYRGNPIGQIRFDQIACGEAEVSVSIDFSMRGRSYGTKIIQLGVKRMCRETNLARFTAYIRPDNIASMRAFRSAGFCKESTEFRNNIELYKLVRQASKRHNSSITPIR